MKKNLARIISVLMTVCLMLLPACEKPMSAKTETPEEFWARPHEWKTGNLSFNGASNEYGYYYEGDQSLLTYFDYATKKSAVMCNKVGCTHEFAGVCEASIKGGIPKMFFRDDKMYLITGKDDGTHIFCCDLDGSNREDKILLMKSEMEKGTAVSEDVFWLNGDNLYYSAQYQSADGDLKNFISSLWRINLKTWTEEELFRSVESMYSIVGMEEGGVLVLDSPRLILLEGLEDYKKAPMTISYLNEKSGTMTPVYQSNAYNTYDVVYVEGSCLYLTDRTEDEKTIGLEKMNMQTGQREWLWKEGAGAGSSINMGYEMERDICFGVSTVNGEHDSLILSKKDFKPVDLPFLKNRCNIEYEDVHGYIVTKVIPKGEYSIGESLGFIPIEEAGKENPEYTVLISYDTSD